MCAYVYIICCYCKCSWDEWAPEARILKYNEANLAKQQDMKKQQERFVIVPHLLTNVVFPLHGVMNV